MGLFVIGDFVRQLRIITFNEVKLIHNKKIEKEYKGIFYHCFCVIIGKSAKPDLRRHCKMQK